MGYTLADAARMLECDRSKVSRIETGQRGIRGKELRELLAEYGVAGNERAILERRHDKHTRHVPDPEIARAHQQARAIVAQWLEADWHPALTGRWHERNQQLAATAAGTLHADVVTHPEMLAVARLLIATRQGQRVGPIDIAGRLDFPYPGRPHQLEPLYACLSQLARQYARHTP